jgi:hypothetical protein
MVRWTVGIPARSVLVKPFGHRLTGQGLPSFPTNRLFSNGRVRTSGAVTLVRYVSRYERAIPQGDQRAFCFACPAPGCLTLSMLPDQKPVSSLTEARNCRSIEQRPVPVNPGIVRRITPTVSTSTTVTAVEAGARFGRLDPDAKFTTRIRSWTRNEKNVRGWKQYLPMVRPPSRSPRVG